MPDELADGISPPGRIRERFELWLDCPVTKLLVSGRDPETLQTHRLPGEDPSDRVARRSVGEPSKPPRSVRSTVRSPVLRAPR